MPAVTLINAVPPFASQEQYNSVVASTPSSFSDIPAVLKYKEENVSVTLDPPVQGFTPDDAASGTLYILTSVLAFVSSTGRAFQIEYPSITLHAVSRSGSRPSIYCQLDESGGVDELEANAPSTINGNHQAQEGEGEEEEGENEYTELRELNIIPPSADSLEPIFEALSQCASLHPDKFSDDEDMEDAIVDAGASPFEAFTGDGDEELSEVGKAALAYLESIIDDPYHPEEEEEEEGEEEEGEEVEEGEEGGSREGDEQTISQIQTAEGHTEEEKQASSKT